MSDKGLLDLLSPSPYVYRNWKTCLREEDFALSSGAIGSWYMRCDLCLQRHADLYAVGVLS
jgi:hypothetical protein